MTVVELGQFIDHAEHIMTGAERMALVWFVASNPEAGSIIPETGGVRKLRWALQGRGKRGGARVIYYYHSENLPIFLLDIYAKNERVNLTKADCHEIRKRIPVLVETYRRRSQ